MGAIKAISLSDWIRPSYLTVEAGKLLSSGEGTGDLLEAIMNGLGWMAHLKDPSYAARIEGFETIHDGLGVFNFISSLGELRNQFQRYNDNDFSGPEIKKDIFKASAKTIYNGSRTAFFLNKTNVISIEPLMQSFKKTLFGALFVLGGLEFFHHKSLAKSQKKDLEKAWGSSEKNILNHRIQLAYANMLKAANTVALASIALVSLLFASLAQGFLFTPGAFLGLTSTWIMLSFASYFYEKMIDQWEVHSLGYFI